MADSTSRSIRVFLSYAHEDEALQKEFSTHLGALKREGLVEVWWDNQIPPGSEWNAEIARKLEAADLIVLLVSSAFLDSVYCYDKEMRRAVERHEAGRARVVPILVRECYWQPAPFAKLQGLPKGMKPITAWPKQKRDAVWAEVAKGIHQAAQACSALPKKSDDRPLFHVPFPRNRFFTGRQDTLDAVRRVLGADGTAVVSQVAVITGLGGIGKTQTALEYYYRYREAYRVVWWMEADSVAGLDRSVAELAAALRLPGADPADPVRTRAALCRWLESESGWLLIFDSAEQPETLRPYLPATPKGHVLITSRNPLWSTVGETLPLDPWPLETSVDFLTQRAKRADPAGAAALAAELGGLPLALEEAAAYVEATGQSFAGYLQNYRKQFAALAGDDAFRPGTYPNTVLTTWGVSWAAATQENPGAADLLRLFAFYAPEDIPRALLTTQAEKLPHPLARGLAEGVAFDKAAAALVRYSLIKATPDSFAVHRLVQAVTRARVSDPLPWADAAIALVNAAFPDHSGDVRFWPACARLRPHAEAALAAAQDLPTNAAHTSRLLDRLAFYLYSQGLYPAAQPLFERALAIREQALGPKHPDVAESLNNLAALYRDQGHYNEAELLLQRALAIWEQALGPEHPDVATGLCGLAELYHAQGRYGEAAPLCERALAILEKALGPEHPAMATYLNNLATLYRDQGRYGEAAPLCHRALAIWEQALGPEHPDVATYLNNLAVIHSGQGHYSEAAPLYQRALAIREQALGPEHPDVATCLCGLAELYANQGHSGEAEPLYQRALAIREQALGPKHLKTIETRSALSVLAVVQTKAPQDGDP